MDVNERMLSRKLLAWWVLVGALSVLAFSANFASDEQPRDVLYRYDAALVGFLLYALVLGILLVIAVGLDLRETFALRRPTSWRTAAGLGAIFLIGMLALAAALEPVLGGGEEQGLDPSGWRSDRAAAFLLNAIVVAALAPVVEELMFRGLGYYLLAQFGVAAAIVIVGIAFALTHGLVRAFPVLFLIGAGLAFIRARTESIYPAMILHGGFNGIGLVLGVLT